MANNRVALCEEIRSALRGFGGGASFADSAAALFVALGYESTKTVHGLSGEVGDFLNRFADSEFGGKSHKLLADNWQSAHLLFQFTDDEVSASDGTGALDGLKGDFEKGRHKSFVFLAADLEKRKKGRRPRGELAQMARAANKLFAMPAIALLRDGDYLTLAAVHRRAHKRQADRDVLEKVTLIKDIYADNPHRAHLDILADLSFGARLEWMEANRKRQPRDFDGLHSAWEAALDVRELNKRFYRELYQWFETAAKTAKFPSPKERAIPAQEHIIRLITRLLFIWFIKEKKLVAEELFNEAEVKALLKPGGDQSAYYRAVLQNLFFATLNTEIGKRQFSDRVNTTHRDFSRYRYRDLIADEKRFWTLMKKTPFINGGLFDCLDSFEATRDGGYRIDCFSDFSGHRGLLVVPNSLFFGEGGLIPLLQKYKFTVEESTPVEEEVALDPELLGRIFENLLAAVNPETGETARRMTGSYYTPREVVDYMAEESLGAYLSAKVGGASRDAVRGLLSFRRSDDALAGEVGDWDDAVRSALVDAIGEVKILDPAVGSGAFPMGVLHKLSLALARLDPQNKLWPAYQKKRAVAATAAAYDNKDDTARKALLLEINDTFKRYSSEFGRKLFLIQNSVFGADIQTIATQIAKLRFFITLAIEQTPTADAADNYGVKPLPNLETRFVTADTLLPLSGRQKVLADEEVIKTEGALRAVREKYFNAQTRQAKMAIRRDDKKLRATLAKLLARNFTESEAVKVAEWDPYDHGARADWFDPEYMFGETDGFDIIIGNPPYVRADKGPEHLRKRRKILDSGAYKTLWEKWDLYVAFIERGFDLLGEGGVLSYIVPNAYLTAKYAMRSRRFFVQSSRIDRIDFMQELKIFEAEVRNIVFQFTRAAFLTHSPLRLNHFGRVGNYNTLPTNLQTVLGENIFSENLPVKFDFDDCIPWGEIFYVSAGMELQASEKTHHKMFGKKALISLVRDEMHPKRYVEGKDIVPYGVKRVRYLEWGTERSPAYCRAVRFPELFERVKIIKGRMAGAIVDEEGLCTNDSMMASVFWHDLAEVDNRSIRNGIARAIKVKTPTQIAKFRNNAQIISREFNIRYCLAILNSRFAQHFFNQVRRSAIGLYPDDIKKLPIKKVSSAKQEELVRLVDKIMIDKHADPNADTAEWEREIDHLVYALYRLSDNEIKLIER